MKRIFPLLLAAMLLSGCSALLSDYGDYVTALKDHSDSEQLRITNQANAIANAVANVKTATPTESVLLSVIAMQQIERLHPVALNAAKPTTYWDVANTAVGHIPFIASTWGMYRLGKAGIEAAGNVTFGNEATVSNSFSPTETNNLGSGTQTYSGTMPAAEPVIVEPVIVQ